MRKPDALQPALADPRRPQQSGLVAIGFTLVVVLVVIRGVVLVPLVFVVVVVVVVCCKKLSLRSSSGT